MTTFRYPLEWPEGWPRTPAEKQRSDRVFNTMFDRASRQLFGELTRLGGKNIVATSWLPIRADGLPYSDAGRRRIQDPGVSLFFELYGRPIVMAQDLYWSVHGNIRSLGLAIEGLRQMERHGGAHMAERAFDGFAALPPPPRKKNWKEVMFKNANVVVTLEIVEMAYKNLAKTRHPDTGGSTEAFQELTEAYEAARTELGG